MLVEVLLVRGRCVWLAPPLWRGGIRCKPERRLWLVPQQGGRDRKSTV